VNSCDDLVSECYKLIDAGFKPWLLVEPRTVVFVSALVCEGDVSPSMGEADCCNFVGGKADGDHFVTSRFLA
jgi:hypothetical protein